jgi:hypothetical protein
MPAITIMRLILAEHLGPVPTGRSSAARVREKLERALARGEGAIVDLEGVATMSPSFADELFAKTPDAVRFENVPPAVQPLITFVRSGRGRPIGA